MPRGIPRTSRATPISPPTATAAAWRLLAADRGIADTLVAQLTQIGAIRERAAAAAAAPATTAGGRDEAADAAERAALLAELRPPPRRSSACARRGRPPLRRATRPRWRRDAALAARDAAAAARDAAIAERDAAVARAGTPRTVTRYVEERDAAAARDAAVAERDKAAPSATRPRRATAALAARDTALAERDRAVFALATERDRRPSSLADLAVFRDRAARALTANAGTRESMLSLVQTKVLVQKVLLSDAVLAEYPDLADRLDRYLEALAAESRGEAQLETLRDLDEVLAGLAAGEEHRGARRAGGAPHQRPDSRTCCSASSTTSRRCWSSLGRERARGPVDLGGMESADSADYTLLWGG